MTEEGDDAPAHRFVSQDRTFFCSELVIKAFKACGVIKLNHRSCKNFMPVDLTQAKQGFEVIDEATIGPE